MCCGFGKCGERKHGGKVGAGGGKFEASRVTKDSKMYLRVRLEGNRGGRRVQLLSRGRDALTVVTKERGGACPGAVDQ